MKKLKKKKQKTNILCSIAKCSVGPTKGAFQVYNFPYCINFSNSYHIKISSSPQHKSKCQVVVLVRNSDQKSLKGKDLEVLWFPSQCCMWTPMASKYKLLLP